MSTRQQATDEFFAWAEKGGRVDLPLGVVYLTREASPSLYDDAGRETAERQDSVTGRLRLVGGWLEVQGIDWPGVASVLLPASSVLRVEIVREES